MIGPALDALVNEGRDLTAVEAAGAMAAIMAGEATPAQIGAFVTALRLKGETPAEIAGLAREMRRHSRRVECAGPLLDTAGTGGDRSGTFNVSTAAALVAAAAGVPVAKHGNVAASSRSGSADLLAALGARVKLGPEQVAAAICETGFGFMHAQAYHPALRHAAGPRRELAFRTVFNVLGPLTNPAGAQHQLLGAPSAALAEKLAAVLALLGTRRALVVHGEDGLDEISLSGPTLVWDVAGERVRSYQVTPEEAGFARAPLSAVLGGDPAANAATLHRLFAGERGPLRDFLLLNAAAALLAAERVASLGEGAALAAETVDSGAAAATLARFIAFTQSAPEEE